MSNKFAQIADRCKDENFKRIYQITASKTEGKKVFEDGTPTEPMSFTDSEIEEIKEKKKKKILIRMASSCCFL